MLPSSPVNNCIMFLTVTGQRQAAIVSHIPGTTRDVVETHLDIGGYPVVLNDTAGLKLWKYLLMFLLTVTGQRQAAIVSHIPGTTRDVVETHLDIGGYPVVLNDTAGLKLWKYLLMFLLTVTGQRQAAIVSHIPGTTRDVVETHLDIGGYPVVLNDTAGLRSSEDIIEQEGIRRALKRLAVYYKLEYVNIANLIAKNKNIIDS